VPTRQARRAVTSHDVQQLLRYEPPRKREVMARVFELADLVLSVSRFNTERLLEAFPFCRGRVAYVPNAADDLFFEPAAAHERDRVHDDLGLPPGVPYLLSVANFQPRKNLVRLVQAVSRLTEVSQGDLALVIVGTGAEEEARPIREAAVAAGRRALIRLPGYRQGRALRAIYAESAALVFPSLCESFGIPAIEAMAQGIPVAMADSTALPEIGGEAGWYFDPNSEDAIANTIRRLLDDPAERARRAMLGRAIAGHYRWQNSNDLLVEALLARQGRTG
jgi:glycosyltransferase involved in cell wall biosynthesis